MAHYVIVGSLSDPMPAQNARMASAIVDGLHCNPFAEHKGARARGCYTCEHWHGEFFSWHEVRERDHPHGYVPSVPRSGRVHWMRAIGGDDE